MARPKTAKTKNYTIRITPDDENLFKTLALFEKKQYNGVSDYIVKVCRNHAEREIALINKQLNILKETLRKAKDYLTTALDPACPPELFSILFPSYLEEILNVDNIIDCSESAKSSLGDYLVALENGTAVSGSLEQVINLAKQQNNKMSTDKPSDKKSLVVKVDRKLGRKAETMSQTALLAGQAATESAEGGEISPSARQVAVPHKKGQRVKKVDVTGQK
jgi:hypothetical protein